MKVRSGWALLAVVLACGGRVAEVDDGGSSATTVDAQSTSDVGSSGEAGGDSGHSVVDAHAPAKDGSVDPVGPGCATVVRSDSVVASTCDATSSYVYGGEITPGIYDLAGVAEVASFATCAARQPTTYRGSLVVVMSQNGTLLFDERLVEAGSTAPGERTGVITLSALRLSFHPTCGPSMEDEEALYTSDPGTSKVKPWLAYEWRTPGRTFVVRWVRR